MKFYFISMRNKYLRIISMLVFVCLFSITLYPMSASNITPVSSNSGGQDSLHLHVATSNSFKAVQVEPQIRWSTSLTPLFGAVLYDLNNDNVRDVIVPTGASEIYALSGNNGTMLWNHSAEDITGIPAVGDINNDSQPEIIFATFLDGIQVLSSNGTLLKTYLNESYIDDSPIIYDVDNDGQMEIFIGTFAFSVYALKADGSVLWQFYTGGDSKTLALGRFFDGITPVLLVGTNKGTIYALDAKTGYLYWKFDAKQGPVRAAAIGDINNDGVTEVVFISGDNVVYALDGKNGKALWAKHIDGASASTPVLGDVDGDGKLEIIFGSSDNNVYALNGEDGSTLWVFSTNSSISASPVLGDVNGDNRLDVIIGSTDGFLYAINGRNGSLIWKYSSGAVDITSAIGDIDGDGKLEIVSGSTKSIFSLALPKSVSAFLTYWPLLGGTTNQTGNIYDWDEDHDMLSSNAESILGTNPLSNDTDNDGLPDGWEVYYGLNVTHPDNASADWDNDGLMNLQEAHFGTNPRSNDIDGDGIPDKWEINNNYDPVNPNVSIFEYISFNSVWVLPLIFVVIIAGVSGFYLSISRLKEKRKQKAEKEALERMIEHKPESEETNKGIPLIEQSPLLGGFIVGFKNAHKFLLLMTIVFVFSAIVDYNYYVEYLKFTVVGIMPRASLPWGFPELFNFFEFPAQREQIAALQAALPSSLGAILWMGINNVIIYSILEAGYLGELHSTLFRKNKINFVSSLIKYIIPILVFNIFFDSLLYVIVIIAAVVPKVFLGGYIATYAILAVILTGVLTYLFVLVPYIIVADDEKIAVAVKKSITYMFSQEGFLYSIIFSVITAVVSTIISALLPLPWVGYVLSLVIVSYVGVALSISTFYFYEKIRDLPKFKRRLYGTTNDIVPAQNTTIKSKY